MLPCADGVYAHVQAFIAEPRRSVLLCMNCHDQQSLTLSCVVKMGVKRIVLEAAYKKSLSVWTGQSMGFSVLQLHDFLRLEMQYTLIKSDGVAGRCVKLIPPHAALAEQVSHTHISFCFVPCPIMLVQQQPGSLPPTTTPPTHLSMLSPFERLCSL